VTNQAATSSAEATEARDNLQTTYTRPASPPETVMHIGEVAARTELSLRSLRHWEEVGLLTPSGRTEGGFRLYTEADVDKIMVIRRMKPLGFSLDQMKAAMADIATLANDDAGPRAQNSARERLHATQQDAVERRQKLVAQLAMADEFLDLISGRLI
jgi:DNA-binding transcriptional MerR regulator